MFACMALLAALAVPAAWADDSDWLATTNSDGNFHFLAPVAPSVQTSNETDAGVAYTTTVWIARSGGFIEMGEYSVYQPSNNYIDPKLVLQGFLHGLSAQLISSEDQPYARGPNDVLPGLTAAVNNANLTCHVRVAVDGLRVFALTACGQTGYDVTAEMDRAMASFEITK